MSDTQVTPVATPAQGVVPVAAPAVQTNQPVPNPMDPPVQQGIPGTPFENQDALIAAWKNAQTRINELSTPKDPAPAESPSAEPTADNTNDTAETPAWDWSNTFKAYDPEKGWSKDAQSAFEKAGIPSELLEQHYAEIQQLQTIKAEYYKAKAESMVGGPENWTKVAEFIRDNMPDVSEDLNNPNKFEYVIEAAVARMQRDGKIPTTAQPTAEPSGAPNTSLSARGSSVDTLIPGSPEALRATSDPRYRLEFAYRERVDQALLAGAKQR
jgi:hypothetical protein